MRISGEDLHWLYWGSEEEEIISKLINEKNRLIDFIETMSIRFNGDIIKILLLFLTNLRKNEDSPELNIIKSYITKDQIKRLWQLDHKYGILYNYDYEEKLKREKIQQEHDTKINVIQEVLKLQNLIPFDITTRIREIDQFEPINIANKIRDQREAYKLYAKKIEFWNYSHTWDEFDKLVNELLDNEKGENYANI